MNPLHLAHSMSAESRNHAAYDPLEVSAGPGHVALIEPMNGTWGDGVPEQGEERNFKCGCDFLDLICMEDGARCGLRTCLPRLLKAVRNPMTAAMTRSHCQKPCKSGSTGVSAGVNGQQHRTSTEYLELEKAGGSLVVVG